MSTRLVIDALDFAHSGGEHHGKIAISALERLQDYLAGNYGELKYVVTGALDGNGKPMLRIVIQGSINLRCQRCLGEFRHVLDLRTALLLTRNEEDFSHFDENESVDSVLAAPDMDILSLIEDEILLDLPISPRHMEGECSVGISNRSEAADGKPLFNALAQLKKLH